MPRSISVQRGQESEPKIKLAFKSTQKEPMIFGENYAGNFFKEQAKLELRYSKIPKFDPSKPIDFKTTKKPDKEKSIPMTSEIAYLQSLIDMTNWNPKFNVACTLKEL